MKRSQAKIAATFKGYKQRKQYIKERNAAILIASYIRMWKHRKVWLAKKRAEAQAKRNEELAKASVVVAAFVRGWLVRRRTRAMFRCVCSIFSPQSCDTLFFSLLLDVSRVAWLCGFSGRMPVLWLRATLPSIKSECSCSSLRLACLPSRPQTRPGLMRLCRFANSQTSSRTSTTMSAVSTTANSLTRHSRL